MFLKWTLIATFLCVMTNCGFFERVPRNVDERMDAEKESVQYKEGISTVKTPIQKQTCFLGSDEKIIVGCTLGCNENNQNAVNLVAEELKYKIEFTTLNRDNSLKGYNMVDAVIIEGGYDIQPYLYDGKYGKEGISSELLSTINPELSEEEKVEWKNKDVFEYNFLQKYFKEDKFKRIPTLGICRGLQMLSVASGIPLYVDIKNQINEGPFKNTVEKVDILNSESIIGEAIGEKGLEGVEAHHQGVHYQYYLQNKAEFPHISVTATSKNNKIVEAMEFSNRTVLGVQFHPERSNMNVKRRIFRWLLQSACEGKKKILEDVSL